jgi:uncharacterized protein (TIGR02284 family)
MACALHGRPAESEARMATMVGMEKQLDRLLNALIELDYDAIEAYRAAITRLQGSEDRQQLATFMADHERHTRELAPLVSALGKEPAKGADVLQWLTKGKVIIASLVGDKAILMAMKTNEDDTNVAYERAIARTDLPSDVRVVIERNLSDERRHRAYIEARLGLTRAAEAR